MSEERRSFVCAGVESGESFPGCGSADSEGVCMGIKDLRTAKALRNCGQNSGQKGLDNQIMGYWLSDQKSAV